MIIKYPDHHRWVKQVPAADRFVNFGDKAKQKLKSSLNKIANTHISYAIEPVSEEFFTWFMPMYMDNISAKDNPKLSPIKDRVMNSGRQYFSLMLYEEGVPLGGTIFTINENNDLSIAYRTYRQQWSRSSLRANPSLYTEYLIEEHARTLGCKQIVHGRDRNPYGINAGIGLAAFKLSVGCQPYISKTHAVLEFDTTVCDKDVFIFRYPESEDGRIEQAYLLITAETESKWLEVTKYPKKVKSTVLKRFI